MTKNKGNNLRGKIPLLSARQSKKIIAEVMLHILEGPEP